MTSRVRIRPGVPADLDAVARRFFALWDDSPLEEHRAEAAAVLEGKANASLPLVLFVAEVDGRVVGFVEVGLRSHADGCDIRRPVGFLEGWFVDEEFRRAGTGRALVQAAEEWARSQGCAEIASDTWIDDERSQLAHAALGFEVVDRCVNFKKAL